MRMEINRVRDRISEHVARQISGSVTIHVRDMVRNEINAEVRPRNMVREVFGHVNDVCSSWLEWSRR